MENPNSNVNINEKCNKAWIEDNMLLTMFDSSSEINQDALDQLNYFMYCIFGCFFHMLRTGNSIQLIVASYKLLVDLEKLCDHFPREYLSGVDDSLLSSNSQPKLVVTSTWCPLIVGADNATGVGEAQYEEVDSVSSCNPVRIVHD
ncbi:negative regulator of systemic acquired resistance SNI1 [Trifolium repens]|nr:negative regulator of systemic acquired resistance SNI1 [Trifolium repens]